MFCMCVHTYACIYIRACERGKRKMSSNTFSLLSETINKTRPMRASGREAPRVHSVCLEAEDKRT